MANTILNASNEAFEKEQSHDPLAQVLVERGEIWETAKVYVINATRNMDPTAAIEGQVLVDEILHPAKTTKQLNAAAQVVSEQALLESEPASQIPGIISESAALNLSIIRELVAASHPLSDNRSFMERRAAVIAAENKAQSNSIGTGESDHYAV